MNKEVLRIYYKKQKDKGYFSFNCNNPMLITIKPNLERRFEAEVMIHEFIHFMSRRYGRIIGKISEERTMVLGKMFLKILIRRTKY